jgi:hypothetical protein
MTITCFTNAHTLNKFKKVVVTMTVKISDIINLNNDEIINRENAEYSTMNIMNISHIENKNGKQYSNAVNIFSNETYMFKLGNAINCVCPIKIYMNYNVCISKQSENYIRKINQFSKNGEEIMTGISINHIFTGRTIDKYGLITYYKNGILIPDIIT